MTAELGTHFSSLACALAAAFILDALVGDPRGLPHPVRWMGWAIQRAEPIFRRLFRNKPGAELQAGFCFALTLACACGGGATLVLAAVGALSNLLAFILETVLLFYCLSARSLAQAAMEIHGLLIAGQVDAARAAVAMIVGRDVTHCGEEDIARATVETVAENLVDGVLAPLFFAALGGAPLALAYKMINTMDSMVGYKNERYLYFGRAAARLDDLANFLPARLSVPCIALAAALLPRMSALQIWTLAWRDGRRHASPNAGYPEAAFAGALHLWLGGPNSYGGAVVDKPIIGAGLGATRPTHIKTACQLMYLTAILALLAALIFQLAFQLTLRPAL